MAIIHYTNFIIIYKYIYNFPSSYPRTKIESCLYANNVVYS